MAHWIELSISESMINAIQHGNKADPSKQATLRISSSGDAIEIIVEDEGCGFTLDKVADPTDKANLLKPSGRGILIIRSFMDEVDLSQREGGGCRLRMVKRLSGLDGDRPRWACFSIRGVWIASSFWISAAGTQWEKARLSYAIA